MNSFDITFLCERGTHKLSGAKNMPTVEDMQDHIDLLEDFGMGKTKKIVIDNMQ